MSIHLRYNEMVEIFVKLSGHLLIALHKHKHPFSTFWQRAGLFTRVLNILLLLIRQKSKRLSV